MTATADTRQRSQGVASLRGVLLRIRRDFRQLKGAANAIDPAASDYNPQELQPIATSIAGVGSDLGDVAATLAGARPAPLFVPPHRDLSAAVGQLQAGAAALARSVADLQGTSSGQAATDLAQGRADLHACNRILKQAKALLNTIAAAL